MIVHNGIVLYELARPQRGKAEVLGVVECKLCRLAFREDKVRSAEKFERLLQLRIGLDLL
jgi:hypothetical protein